MSVYFYCTAWAFTKKPEDLDAITNEQLVQLAVDSIPPKDKNVEWLIVANKATAGKIESRTRFRMKIYAGESRGYAFHPPNLSKMHPNLLFVEVHGADCAEEEFISLVKDGKTILKRNVVIPYDHELFALLNSDTNDENLYDKVEMVYYDLISKLTPEDFKDTFRQDEHEDFED